MVYSKNFAGCRVFLYNEETGTPISETTVLECDKDRMLITVSGSSLPATVSRLSLLILHEGAVYEFHGSVRRSPQEDRREIALYKGLAKEERISKRYTVNTPVQVVALSDENGMISLARPLDAIAINISTEGILLRTLPSILERDSVFQVKIDFGNSDTLLEARVLRVCEIDSQTTEYGCCFQQE